MLKTESGKIFGLFERLDSEVEGTGINCSGENITLDATGDWTGTIDGNNFAGGAVSTGDLPDCPDLHPLLARIYAGRGVRDPDALDLGLARLLPPDQLTQADAAAALLADATTVLTDMGFTGRQGEHVTVVENTPDTHNVVVCTLCSCYPWGLLGLPPARPASRPDRVA